MSIIEDGNPKKKKKAFGLCEINFFDYIYAGSKIFVLIIINFPLLKTSEYNL